MSGPGGSRPRVFVGLVEVAGFYSRLAAGLRALGADCTLCLIGDHPFGYGGVTRVPWDLRLLRATVARVGRARTAGQPVRALPWRLVGLLARIALFLRVALTHDVFVFGFGLTFFRGRDLPFLRLLGRKVIVVFNGSDHRPPYLNGVACRTPDDARHPRLRQETERIKRLVTSLERNADVVVAHHLSAQFHERPFVPSGVIGLPCVIPPAEPAGASAEGRPVRVLHAPSLSAVKGTDRIRAAIAALKGRGLAIDYVEITGRPNSEVLDELRRCDLVVDELFSDARMAGLASEAAMFAKPVIVAGYASDDRMRIPGIFERDDFPPVLYCRPEDVETSIERLVVDAAARLDLGRRARRYVETRWPSERVAEQFLRLAGVDGEAVPRVDPGALRYFHGFGLDEGALAGVLRTFAETWGFDALRLNDKPELLAAVRQFSMEHG